MSLLGYTLTKNELMLIMNYVDGSNLDSLIFGCDEVVGKVQYVLPLYIVFLSYIIVAYTDD